MRAHSCPTLCDPMDCSPPGSSVQGISQARILAWVAHSFSRGSSWPWNWTCISYVFCTGRRILLNIVIIYRNLWGIWSTESLIRWWGFFFFSVGSSGQSLIWHQSHRVTNLFSELQFPHPWHKGLNLHASLTVSKAVFPKVGAMDHPHQTHLRHFITISPKTSGVRICIFSKLSA